MIKTINLNIVKMSKIDLMKNEDTKTKQPKMYTIQFGELNSQINNNKLFPDNTVSSTNYTIYNFFPKASLLQFKKTANLYNLIICILSFFSFSTKSPVSLIVPLMFTALISIFKEAYEDYERNKLDQKLNMREVLRYTEGKFTKTQCYTLIPGDIIKVEKDEEIPVDCLLIKSSHGKGICFINSTSLDGEATLKEKIPVEEFKNLNFSSNGGIDIQGRIECDEPNEILSSWEGIMYLNNLKIFCSLKNLILKSCILKNTKWAIGIVVYSGINTKIMMNSKKSFEKIL